MKNILIIGLLFLSPICIAQIPDSLTLKDLEIPSSPGFILLDQAPTSIERPNSPKAFALSIFNSFGEANGFPKNYAVEFTPFWYFKHPKMNVLKYAGYSNGKPQPFSSLKMFSLSMAYVNNTDSITNKPINNVAFGARTNILKIRSKKDLGALKKANDEAASALKSLDSIIVSRIGPFNPIDPIGFRQKETELLALLEDSLKNNIGEVLKRKPILAIDAAIAYNTFFMDNNFSTNRFGRFGTWLTLNYSQSLNEENSNYLNLYSVVRYISDGTNKNSQDEYQNQDNIDFGGKIELEFKKLSLSYEYIHRTNDKNNTFRSTGQLKYKLSDNLYLTGAYGKNFGDTNNLVSLLGINWGLNTGNEKATID